jgi:peptidyl-tRNA hydrolase
MSNKMADDIPVLYVIVRTDMQSMTPGKAQAHSGHAANAFVHKHLVKRIQKGQELGAAVVEWMKSTDQGFGTQINLKASWADAVDAHTRAKQLGVMTEMVLDPTYPYIVDSEVAALIDPKHHSVDPIVIDNGKVVCHRAEYTAIYFFGMKSDLKQFVGEFPLHP